MKKLTPPSVRRGNLGCAALMVIVFLGLAWLAGHRIIKDGTAAQSRAEIILTAPDVQARLGCSPDAGRWVSVTSAQGHVRFAKFKMSEEDYLFITGAPLASKAVDLAKAGMRARLTAQYQSGTKERALAARIQHGVFAAFDGEGTITVAPDGDILISTEERPLDAVKVSPDVFRKLCPEEFALANALCKQGW